LHAVSYLQQLAASIQAWVSQHEAGLQTGATQHGAGLKTWAPDHPVETVVIGIALIVLLRLLPGPRRRG
jgi:hypothetical protein